MPIYLDVEHAGLPRTVAPVYERLTVPDSMGMCLQDAADRWLAKEITVSFGDASIRVWVRGIEEVP